MPPVCFRPTIFVILSSNQFHENIMPIFNLKNVFFFCPSGSIFLCQALLVSVPLLLKHVEMATNIISLKCMPLALISGKFISQCISAHYTALKFMNSMNAFLQSINPTAMENTEDLIVKTCTPLSLIKKNKSHYASLTAISNTSDNIQEAPLQSMEFIVLQDTHTANCPSEYYTR